MFAPPQEEHKWLDSFVGEWEVDSECVMGPDQPPQKSQGRAKTRSLGGMWILIEGEGESPDGGATVESIITIGYDPAQQRYVGSFICGVMTHLWIYHGSLDAAKRKLTLDTTGPKFDGSGMTQYQDMCEVVSADHWILSSQMQMDDGTWVPFMTAHYRRKK